MAMIDKYKSIYNDNNDEKKYQMYLDFPKNSIPKGSSIVIYGAGRIGCQLYKELSENKYCVVRLWVDKNKHDEYVTSDLSEILNTRYDFIVIAIKKKDLAVEAEKELIKIGVPADCIIKLSGEKKSEITDKYKKFYDKTIIDRWEDTHNNLDFKMPYSITSMICNRSFFDTPFSQYWGNKVGKCFVHLMKSSDQYWDGMCENHLVYHRKLWEFIFICQGLYERGMLTNGKQGVAFGVGEECLPDLFASMGCSILATDLCKEDAKQHGWLEHAENIGGNYWRLNQYGFCFREDFEQRVKYRDVNMNEIPEDITGYDFCWSACALEHLGSLRHGMDFVHNSLNVLQDGGIAIHTTEYNLYSQEKTYESKGLSIYRRKDIETLINELEAEGHYVYPMDWYIGDSICDRFVDIPPYSKKDLHLRLLIDNYPSTSIGLVIKKNGKEVAQ